MATITAPPSPPANFYAAKSIRGANGVQLDIFGYPLPNDLPTQAQNLTAPFTYLNQTTLFDVSSLTPNHEVIVVGYSSPTNINSDMTLMATWYRSRDHTKVFEYSTLVAAPGGPGSGAGFWIGWLDEFVNVPSYPMFKEIQENGNYYVNISATGGQTFSQTINFAVKGIPPSVVFSDVTASSFSWLVRVSDYFDTTNYIQAGICTEPITDGQSTPPNGIIDSKSALSSTIACVVEGTVSGANLNAYGTVYGFAQAANGLYYQAGMYESSRPPNWNWSSTIVSGQPFSISATEWNNFMDRVQQFWEYKGFTVFPHDVVSSGEQFKATYFNGARGRISLLNPSVAPPGTKSSGNIIYASDFILLRDSLNSIP